MIKNDYQCDVCGKLEELPTGYHQCCGQEMRKLWGVVGVIIKGDNSASVQKNR